VDSGVFLNGRGGRHEIDFIKISRNIITDKFDINRAITSKDKYEQGDQKQG
jgi:hypothetical protein